VHTGPVVAGIVGKRKFQYDVWGDTVNTAERMESSGAAGQVNISQATHDFLGNRFKFVARGELEAKGKGKLAMFLRRSSGSFRAGPHRKRGGGRVEP
jgi:class 3 adenylate cyclase